MTDQQRDDADRDDEGAMGQATRADWARGQGATSSDVAGPQEGGSADNDGGTSGDYVTGDLKDEGHQGGPS
jgi:hypothetical protein